MHMNHKPDDSHEMLNKSQIYQGKATIRKHRLYNGLKEEERKNKTKIKTKTAYRIRPNYRTYPYKRIVKQFRSLQITASVLFVYFFVKAYVVGTHLNCIDLSMQFK